MPAHNAHHHHQSIYNIDPGMGDLTSPHPPGSPTSRPPACTTTFLTAPCPRHGSRCRTGEDGFCPNGAGVRRGTGATGAEAVGRAGGGGRGGPVRLGPGLDAFPDLLGGEALPLVMEVYGWLSWATSGISRGQRNGPCDAVLLQRDRWNREAGPGGWVAQKDHERVSWAVIWAGWLDRGPTWPALLEGGPVLRVTAAEANNWQPRALFTALTHWRYCQRNPPLPQPQPQHKRRRRLRPHPSAFARHQASSAPDLSQGTRGAGSGPMARGTPPAGEGPTTLSPPPTPAAVRAAGGQPSPPVEETAEATSARAVGVRQQRGAHRRARQGGPTDPLTTDH